MRFGIRKLRRRRVLVGHRCGDSQGGPTQQREVVNKRIVYVSAHFDVVPMMLLDLGPPPEEQPPGDLAGMPGTSRAG